MIMISSELRRVFFLTEKCASTSIRETFIKTKKWIRIPSLLPRDAYKELNKVAADWRDFKSYAVVRNPYDRAVSYWAYRRRTGVTRLGFEQFILGGHLDMRTLTDVLSFVRLDVVYEFKGFVESFKEDFGLDIGVLNPAEHAPFQRYYVAYPDTVLVVHAWGGVDFVNYNYDIMEMANEGA